MDVGFRICQAICIADGFVPMCLEGKMEHIWCWPSKSDPELQYLPKKMKLFNTIYAINQARKPNKDFVARKVTVAPA